jgi:DNA-binding NarL/FixJ family response regulator
MALLRTLLLIPRQQERSASMVMPGSAQPPWRVLLVDDDQEYLRLLEWLLRDTPALRITGKASSVQEGLVALGVQPADIVLMAVHMPGTDGLKAVPLVRAVAPSAAVILMATLEESEYAAAAAAVGAHGFLSKANVTGDALLALCHALP